MRRGPWGRYWRRRPRERFRTSEASGRIPRLGFGPALKGPGPIRNLSRTAKGTGDNTKLVGDYNNPILRPEAAAIIKRRGEVSISGKIFPDPDAMCLQQPVPYIFWNFDLVFLQQKDKVTLIYQHDNDFRQVWLNQGHPANLEPSAHGHSVGHYEGDTLVIDTVGVAVGPYTTIDRLGTPYSDSLHVVERYRMLPYEQAKAAMDLAEKEWMRAGPTVDPNYRGHGVQLEFVVEDHRMFTMPWSASITYLRASAPSGRSASARRTSSTTTISTTSPTTRSCRPTTRRISERQ